MDCNQQIIDAIITLMEEIPGHAAPLLDVIDRHVWDGERDILSIQCNDNEEVYIIVTTDKIFRIAY